MEKSFYRNGSIKIPTIRELSETETTIMDKNVAAFRKLYKERQDVILFATREAANMLLCSESAWGHYARNTVKEIKTADSDNARNIAMVKAEADIMCLAHIFSVKYYERKTYYVALRIDMATRDHKFEKLPGYFSTKMALQVIRKVYSEFIR